MPLLDSVRQWWNALAKRAALASDEGLTLIEMLGVVVILGVVAAIAIPAVSSAISQSKVNSTESSLGTLQSALSRYYMDEGQYPATLSDLTSQASANGSGNWNGPYIRETFPMKDAWGNAIEYGPVTASSGTGSVGSSTDPVLGYVLLSGDGNPIATSALPTDFATSSTSTTDYVYAAGGDFVNSSGSSVYIGVGPGVAPAEKVVASDPDLAKAIAAESNWTTN